MKRILYRLFILILFVSVAIGTYAYCYFVIQGPLLGQTIESIKPVSVPLQVGIHAPLGAPLSAGVGNIVYSGAYIRSYPVYKPTGELMLDMPTGVIPSFMNPGVGWGAYFKMAEGSLLAEAPGPMQPSGFRLSLRIDQGGRVVGDSPWYDVASKKELEQLPWGDSERKLFVLSGHHPVEEQFFEMYYEGVKACDGTVSGWEGYDGCIGVFKYYKYNAGESKPVQETTYIVDENDTFIMDGVKVSLELITPQLVKYVIRPIR